MAHDINEALVTEHESRLLDRYEDVEHRETTFHAEDEAFPDLREYAEDGYIGAAYARVVRTAGQAPPLSASMDESDTDDSDRVLFVLHRGATQWDLPGGGHESDESFEETAVREVREETGISCEVTDAVSVEHEVTVADGYDDRLHTLWVYVEAVYRDGAIAIQNTELNGAAWFSTRPPALKDDPGRLAEDWFA